MRNNKRLAALALVLLLAALPGCAKAEPEESATPKLSYATDGVTAVEDPEAFQKAVDEMVEEAKASGVTLEYKGEGDSTDGETFTCYLANAVENEYDMFLSIYGDATMSEEFFLSGLLRPGEAFESVKLSKTLEKGDHTVYIAFTQVEEDLETLHAQVVVTALFTVS